MSKFRREGAHFAPRGTIRGRRVRATAGVITLAVAALAGWLPAPLNTEAAGAATSCVTPRVLAQHVNQGLPHNGTSSTLVHGKRTIVKFHLGLPARSTTCPTSVAVKILAARLDVIVRTNGTPQTIGTVDASAPLEVLTYQGDAPQNNSPSDPIFAVPASVMAQLPAGGGAIEFRGHIDYGTGVLNPIASSVVSSRSNTLRVLVVPVGSIADGYAATLSSEAITAVDAGFRSMARQLPVPDGVSDLSDATSGAGLRYRINQSILDIPKPGSGKWCLTERLFTDIARKLDVFRDQWNTANPPALHADRVLGVGDSNRWSGGEVPGCYDGMADINSVHAFARAVHDRPGKLEAGALATHEILHSLNLVAGTPGYHSDNFYADGATGARSFRGHNLDTLAWLGEPKSVMNIATPFRNDTTLLETRDWNATLCVFGGGVSCPSGLTKVGAAPSTSPSTLSASRASSGGAQDRVVISGVTNGSFTDIHSFVTHETDLPGVQTEPSSSAEWQFVGTSVGSGGEVVTTTFNFATSDLLAGGTLDATARPNCPSGTGPCRSFSFVVPLEVADSVAELKKFELRRNQQTFKTEERSKARPTVTDVNVTSSTAGMSGIEIGDGSDPDVSPDAASVAYVGPTGCLVAQPTSTSSASARAQLCTRPDGSALNASSPSWAPDNRTVVFVSGGQLHRSTYTAGATASLSPAQAIGACVAAATGCLVTTGLPVSLGDITSPSWSQAGVDGGARQLIAFNAKKGGQDTIYVIDPAVVPVGGLHPAFEVTAGQRPAFSHDPGRRGELLFESGSVIRVVNALTAMSSLEKPAGVDVLAGRRPMWGSRFVALEVGTSIALADYRADNPTPSASVKVTGSAPSISSNGANGEFGQVVAYQEGPKVKVLTFSSDGKRTITVRGTDDDASTVRIATFLVCGVKSGSSPTWPLSPAPKFTDPIAVELTPTLTGSSDGLDSYSVEHDYDPDGFVCGDGAGDVTLSAARANDGLLDSGIKVGGPIRPRKKKPVPTIVYPLENEVITTRAVFVGGVNDAYDVSIPDTSFDWYLERNGNVVRTLEGRAPAPLADLPDGHYVARLRVENVNSDHDEVTRTFVVMRNPIAGIFDPGSISLPDTSKTTSVVTVTVDLSGRVSGPISINTDDRFRLFDANKVTANTRLPFPATGFSAVEAKVVSQTPPKITLKFNRPSLSNYLLENQLHGSVIQMSVMGSVTDRTGKVSFFSVDPSRPCVFLQNSGGSSC